MIILDGNRNVQKGHRLGGYDEGEVDGGMERLDKVGELEKIRFRQRGGPQAIIDEAPVKFRYRASVGIQHLFLKVSHEQTGITWAHLGAHGHPTDL